MSAVEWASEKTIDQQSVYCFDTKNNLYAKSMSPPKTFLTKQEANCKSPFISLND
jgi:hypothetical protein